MRKLLTTAHPAALVLLLMACSSNPGDDSISNRLPPAAGAQDCGLCHSAILGPRRAILGTSGDFAQNPGISSHHVSGTADPTASQCVVCHNMDQHGSGRVRLNNADTGAVVTFTTPSSLEPFCRSCHDVDGARGNTSPFSDGSVIGSGMFQASATISSSWNKSFGHRRKGLTCVGTGSPNTGCHANGHGSSHVGLLARNMTLPLPPDAYRENDFQLCFDCHDAYPQVAKEAVFGVNFSGNYYGGYGPGLAFPPYDIQAITTRFRDQNNRGTGLPYDDSSIWIDFWFWGSNSANLHWRHIAWLEWQYRGAVPSGTSCTACHNVHGTNTQWGMVHDEMEYAHYSGIGGDQYAQMSAVDPFTLDQYPVYCTFGCHRPTTPGFGKASAWFEPPNE
jgi:hypothetical protein